MNRLGTQDSGFQLPLHLRPSSDGIQASRGRVRYHHHLLGYLYFPHLPLASVLNSIWRTSICAGGLFLL